ncbi:MAG: gliding motility protein GldC [Flavobacteriales bacterium]|jgi:gliding motility-associated protein GldC|nr:gliding motility protein GldC [Flavobacteriales bacterium]
MSQSSQITFDVTLDDNKVPEKITWLASDADMDKALDSKAVMLSIYDTESEETMRIDLWTKEMRVDEMKRFFHQTILSMADTLQRSTSEDQMAKDMREFGKHFAKEIFG